MNNPTHESSASGTGVDTHKPCLALIWLKGTTSGTEQNRVRELVMSRAGVASIETSARSAGLFIVRFDRSATCASGIVGWLRKSGLPAVIVGC